MAEYDIPSQIKNKSERIKRYCEGELSRRFRMPLEIDEETANAIAYYVSTHKVEEADTVWLGKRRLKRNGLRLRLKLEYQPEATTH